METRPPLQEHSFKMFLSVTIEYFTTKIYFIKQKTCSFFKKSLQFFNVKTPKILNSKKKSGLELVSQKNLP